METLPSVPVADYLAALRFDLTDYARLVMTNPVYCVLNCCRILAYQRDGVILSKAEGGAYALEQLPSRYHSLIKAALSTYRDEIDRLSVNSHWYQEFVAYTLAELSNEHRASE